MRSADFSNAPRAASAGALFVGAWFLAGPLSPVLFVMLAALLSIAVVALFIRIDRNHVPKALIWIAGVLATGAILFVVFV